MTTLSVEKRSQAGKQLNELRSAGRVPAVVYGPKDEPISVSFTALELEQILAREGESSVITLSGDDVEKDVLIQDIQMHPLRDSIEHVDFYVIDKTKKIETEVPLEFTGEAPAVKSLGGTLVKVMHEIEIRSLPTEIPQNIEVDISSLEDFDSSILVKDLKLPEGVEPVTDPEETVAIAEAPREEEPEEPEEEMNLEDIEVEQKGKEASEEESEGETETDEEQ